MTETDDVSARLFTLETVLRHLVTHLALRSDDPPGWVATRRVLALHEVQEHAPCLDEPKTREQLAGLKQAISGFFDPVEGVLGDYSASSQGLREGTSTPGLR